MADHQLPPLEYRDPQMDRAPLRTELWQIVGGLIAGCSVVIISGMNMSLSNIHYTASTQPLAWQTTTLEWRGPLNFALVLLAVLGGFAILAWRFGKRSFSQAALIGAGIMLLVEGICFWRQWS